MSDDEYRAFAKEGVARFSRRPIDEAAWNAFASILFFISADLDEDRGLAALGARLDIIEHERGDAGGRIYYLAVPPSLFAPTVTHLARARFVPPSTGKIARLI